jgi:hypothetical protein
MKRTIALLLCLLVPSVAFAADNPNTFKVNYDGGTLPDIKANTTAFILVDQTHIRVMRDKVEIAVIPVASVTEISYGQDVHRRIGAAIGIGIFTLGIGALMALTKSKKHFIGLTWVDGEKKGGFAMQCDKNEYRGFLAALEGVTGKKAVNSDTMTVKN